MEKEIEGSLLKKKARVIAFYLPQFFPIPENDEWWGKGFTEWTNVGKAKPLFRGHYQPRVPADLGYYDLRLPEIREAQAKMAKESGVEGFMYWHYWFGNGKKILERVFSEVLKTKRPDYPFCLGWANHSWENKTWDASQQYNKTITLIKQEYPGLEDYKNHFFYVLDAVRDDRYITVDGKPLFFIYAPLAFPDIKTFMTCWQSLAVQNGLKGIYFVGQAYFNSECSKILDLGFDGVCRLGIADAEYAVKGKYFFKVLKRMRMYTRFAPLNKFDHKKISRYLTAPSLDTQNNIYPAVMPNFDHSPRSGRKGRIYYNSTPELFRKILRDSLALIKRKPDDHKIIFLRSWNEWAEGNYVEPDLKYGHGYLDVLKDEILGED